jgi:glutamyl/glutaminyl-tRNA synthetase
MAELDTRDREKLDKRKFAYVDRNGEGHLPIHDEAHVRNALARWNQTAFESEEAKRAARRKVLAAAKRYGIEVDKDDNVKKPVRSLRAASTKTGPRGGRRRITRRTSTRRRTTSRRKR